MFFWATEGVGLVLCRPVPYRLSSIGRMDRSLCSFRWGSRGARIPAASGPGTATGSDRLAEFDQPVQQASYMFVSAFDNQQNWRSEPSRDDCRPAFRDLPRSPARLTCGRQSANAFIAAGSPAKCRGRRRSGIIRFDESNNQSLLRQTA